MLPKPAVDDEARPPGPVSGFHPAHVEYEVPAWSELPAGPDQRTGAAVDGEPLVLGRIPFLIY